MLVAYPVAGKKKSSDICEAFIAGAPKDAEGAVFYGVDESNLRDWQRVRAERECFYYLDNAWFDSCRNTYFRVARNAVQIDGRGPSNGRRFEALALTIKPWRESAKHIVVCPQSDWFMARIAERPTWLKETMQALRRLTQREVRMREWGRDKAALTATLVDNLGDAHALVTYSSAAAVTALLNGVPIVVEDGAAWIMGNYLEEIESLYLPPDRERFFGVLADNQWTLAEMRAGLAWESLGDR